jgi:hypothetical protein
LIFLLLVWFAGCTSSRTANDGDALKDKDVTKNADADDDETEEPEAGLPHPKKPTAWDTRVLISTTPQPNSTKISDCFEQIHRIATDAGNQQDMLAAQSHVTNLAAQDVKTYHFCFYQMMVRLDERLDVGGPMMTELADAFFDNMKQLWLLARGLDQLGGQKLYFDYLQQRYVQQSRQYFGREVDVVGPPMGDVAQDSAVTATAPMAKPAASVPAH